MLRFTSVDTRLEFDDVFLSSGRIRENVVDMEYRCRKRGIERRREEPPINLTERKAARAHATLSHAGISKHFLEVSSRHATSRGVSQEQGPLTRLRPRGSYVFTRHKVVYTHAPAGDE